MSLPRFSVKNPVAVNLLMWLLVVGGVLAWQRLVREVLPNVEAEAIDITVPFPGASPDEVEELVTRQLELELKGLEDIEEMTSHVYEGLSITTLELEDGADRSELLNDVRTRVDRVEADFPDDAEDAYVTERRPRLPVIGAVVFGDVGEDALHRAALALRDEMRNLPGLTEVHASGMRAREVWIEADPAALEEHGLTFAELGAAVAASNLDVAGGQLKGTRGNMRLRTLGEEQRPAAIERIVVGAHPDGALVRLADVARVRDTFADEVERGRYRGKPAVLVSVFKTPEQDALEIAARVKRFVAEKGSLLGGAVEIDIANDLSRFIDQRLELMVRNARFGLVLVLLSLAVFLELRVAFWVALGIPISFMGTFVAMHLFGATINMLSVLGLIIVLGMIVDDAIIIGENVFTKLRQGLPPAKAAVEGAVEVSLPVLAAVITTMITFVPLGFIDGRLGNMLGVLPVVVIAALSVSLIEAFIILPAHLGHSRPGGPFARVRLFHTWAVKAHGLRGYLFEQLLPDGLERVLRLLLGWRYVTLAAALGLAVASTGLVAGGHVPFVLLHEVDAEHLSIELEAAAGTPEERTAEILEAMEEAALALPEVKSTFLIVGSTLGIEGRSAAADPATVGQVIVDLVAADEREAEGMRSSAAVLTELRRRTQGFADVDRLTCDARSGGPEGPDIELRVRAREGADVAGAVAAVTTLLERYDGVSEVRDDLRPGKLEARFRLRERARALGLTTRDVALQLRHAVYGFEAQELQVGDERVKVRLLLPERCRRSVGALGRMRIRTPMGRRVPIGEVAALRIERGYASLMRVDGERAVTVRADVDEARANTSEITADLAPAVAALRTRFPGVEFAFFGEHKETIDSLGSITRSFPIALFVVFSIVAVVFRSYAQPLIVMTAIPFSIVGAVVGHFVMGYPLTILSIVGLVALAGIVVNDSLILVDFINRARLGGAPVLDAALQGARSRVRAIVLTTVTTCAGLAPLMLETSFQAQFIIPMSISIVFGLAFATAITLVLVPTIYLVLDDVVTLLRWLVTGRWTRRVRDVGAEADV